MESVPGPGHGTTNAAPESSGGSRHELDRQSHSGIWHEIDDLWNRQPLGADFSWPHEVTWRAARVHAECSGRTRGALRCRRADRTARGHDPRGQGVRPQPEAGGAGRFARGENLEFPPCRSVAFTPPGRPHSEDPAVAGSARHHRDDGLSPAVTAPARRAGDGPARSGEERQDLSPRGPDPGGSCDGETRRVGEGTTAASAAVLSVKSSQRGVARISSAWPVSARNLRMSERGVTNVWPGIGTSMYHG